MATEYRILSADDFVRLRESDNPEEYHKAAYGHADDAVWVEVLARFPEMTKWVAHNKNVPISILRILIHDENTEVRSMVASKRKLEGDMFDTLAKDPDAGVRQRLAYNAKITPAALAKLKQDADPIVREAALER